MMTAEEQLDDRLHDAPGARDFINRVVNAAEDVAIALTGKSDDEARARLEVTRENLKRDLAPLIGADPAAEVADIFCRAVLGEKAEREALIAQGILKSRSSPPGRRACL